MRAGLIVGMIVGGVACGARGSTGTGSPAPPALPLVAPAPRAPGDACESPPAGLSRDVRPAEAPPVAGRSSDDAMAAKALFDRERWAEAERALREVVDGRTKDDAGNRQLADFFLAVTLYRLGKIDESVASFRAIAHRPSHLKHSETLLWIERIAEEHPALFRFDDLSDYTRPDIDRFDNEAQRKVYGALLYLMGHLRYDQGDDEAAARDFAAATRYQPWFREAERCLRRVSARSGESRDPPNRIR